MKLELDLSLSNATQYSMDPAALKKLAIKLFFSFPSSTIPYSLSFSKTNRDVAKLNRNREKKPGEARKLIEMAKDAPEWF